MRDGCEPKSYRTKAMTAITMTTISTVPRMYLLAENHDSEDKTPPPRKDKAGEFSEETSAVECEDSCGVGADVGGGLGFFTGEGEVAAAVSIECGRSARNCPVWPDGTSTADSGAGAVRSSLPTPADI